ncbi:MAG: ATP-dependent DNA helicase RecG [Vulcanimicrobiota bacterium]
MTTFNECIDMVTRPFSLEEKMSFSNVSVFGGFDCYVLHWIDEAGKYSDDTEFLNILKQISALFNKYRLEAPPRRRHIHISALQLLQELKEMHSGKSALNPSAGKGTGIRKDEEAAPGPASATEVYRKRGEKAEQMQPKPAAAAYVSGKVGEKAEHTAPGAADKAGAIAMIPEQRREVREKPGQALLAKVKDRFVPPLDSPVQFAKGVGPQLAKKMHKMEIRTLEDLVFHFPRRYEDRSRLTPIAEVQDGSFETVSGVVAAKSESRPRGGLVISKVMIDDGTGVMVLLWFNQPFRSAHLLKGMKLYASGRVERNYREIQMNNPEYELESDEDTLNTGRIVPVYPSTENLSQKVLRKIVRLNLESSLHLFEDALPEEIRSRHAFPDYRSALSAIHFPEDFEALEKARRRLIYDELFFLELGLLRFKKDRQVIEKEHRYNTDSSISATFEQHLPFALTRAQKKVMEEITGDLFTTRPMCRLVQGDVGSGKTVVAAFAILAAVSSGFQGSVMAPTEILAEQHHKKFRELLAPLNIEVGILIGSLSKKEKELQRSRIRSGEMQVVIGTHALIQEEVEFCNLGLAVVDEQHRFGVLQRAELQKKGTNPDMLVMTATPIPRTLALTLYGDLDISVIDELPPGRKPVISRWCRSREAPRIYQFIKSEIKKGRQSYLVCPLIEESDKIAAKAATREAEELAATHFSDVRVGLLHGRIKGAEKEEIMKKFRDGAIDVLISTTVIEVGVDIPNASVMVIQNAERFGLSQLHQLRGRVGRGDYKSYCFLIADPKSEEGATRMSIMQQHHDGFLIAEKDLQIRGPGDFYGTRQHGLPDLKISDLIRDHGVLEQARIDAEELVKSNPSVYEEKLVKKRIEHTFLPINELRH